MKCECCKTSFIARIADRKRGWGRFCSKNCKAKMQHVDHEISAEKERQFQQMLKRIRAKQKRDARQAK